MRVRRCALGAPAVVRVLGILCAILRIPSLREQLPPVPERVRGAPGRARFACVRGIFLTSLAAGAAARSAFPCLNRRPLGRPSFLVAVDFFFYGRRRRI